MRIHSLPSIPTAGATTPVNLSGVLMMRHRSAGSMSSENGLQKHQQQQQQMLRATRLLSPSSDIDPHNNGHHHHHQFHPHPHPTYAHTQLPLATTDGAGGHDPTFDFAFSQANHDNNNNAGNSNSTTGHPSPWMATPFSSPAMGTFDMSPYATTLDLMGGGGGGGGSCNDNGNNNHQLPSLFQTQFDSQQQQHQNQALLDEQTLQATFMAHAFAKHGSGWDAMIGQGNVGGNGHNQGRHTI